MIDTHLHTNFNDEKLKVAAVQSQVDYSMAGLNAEMVANKIDYAISIRINLSSIETRLKDDGGCSLSGLKLPKNLFDVAYINPYLDSTVQLKQVETLMAKKLIHGIKIYLGYYHLFPTDNFYLPFYSLAQKYDLPVIFHTGDTYSFAAKLKYAHPLLIDDLAVDFPKTKFVIAHFGSPWVMDAAEVIFKNDNVYADLSGWILAENIENVPTNLIKEALRYCEYRNIMYGSDWPLVKMAFNLKYIDSLIPEEHKQNVFTKTAAKLYHIPL